jgi:hypothetical protein
MSLLYPFLHYFVQATVQTKVSAVLESAAFFKFDFFLDDFFVKTSVRKAFMAITSFLLFQT